MAMRSNNSPSRKVILLIDDEPSFRSLIADLLEGNHVIPFANGEESLAWLKKHPEMKVDLVISDYNMPGRNGVEICGEIRAMAPQAKFVLMSATVHEDLERVVRKNQFDGWLFKPFPTAALEDLVRKLLPNAVLPQET